MLLETLAAAAELDAAGIAADVVCLTSADLVFRALQARRGLADGDESVLDDILPAERAAPMVTVLDGHPATLSWLGSVMGHRTRSLGVEHFGQTGTVTDLYRHFGIDAQGIATAAAMIAPGRPVRHLRAVP